jgi:hypothetical protein
MTLEDSIMSTLGKWVNGNSAAMLGFDSKQEKGRKDSMVLELPPPLH